jgi:hypothetical protein
MVKVFSVRITFQQFIYLSSLVPCNFFLPEQLCEPIIQALFYVYFLRCSRVCSAFLSNPSKVSSIFFFSFLYCPLVFFAQPLKYWHSLRILPCHLSLGVLPTKVFVHISLTSFIKPSLKSHPNLNLNIACIAIRTDSSEFNKRGV